MSEGQSGIREKRADPPFLNVLTRRGKTRIITNSLYGYHVAKYLRSNKPGVRFTTHNGVSQASRARYSRLRWHPLASRRVGGGSTERRIINVLIGARIDRSSEKRAPFRPAAHPLA